MVTAADYKVVIPARFAASRLPGKPLCSIGDKPMIQWVYELACRATEGEVVVAHDDDRIGEAVRSFGGRDMLTRSEHRSGTDRVAEVAERLGWPDDVVVVNLQGDEPAMPPELLSIVAQALRDDGGAGIATLAAPIHSLEVWRNPNVVKVVLDGGSRARYFSRAPIPVVRELSDPGARPAALPDGVPFLRHLGIYAYRVGTLGKLCAHPVVPIERAERLEQLRALYLGVEIHVAVVEQAPPHGVDTPEDLVATRRLLTSGGVDHE